MLTLDDGILLSTWCAFGVAGTLVLIESWQDWIERRLSEHIGVFRFVLFMVLTAGGIGTLLLAGMFHHAHKMTMRRHGRQAREVTPKRPNRLLWLGLMLLMLGNVSCFIPRPRLRPLPGHPMTAR